MIGRSEWKNVHKQGLPGREGEKREQKEERIGLRLGRSFVRHAYAPNLT
jgi:hypothetical protein